MTNKNYIAIINIVARDATKKNRTAEGSDNLSLFKLKAKIIEKGMNVEKLAEAIGIDRSGLYRRLNNFEKFTIGEANRIKEVLELTNEEATDIFFS